jgi:hypothetical protein
MKLQINTRGSWRDVVAFDAERAPEVEDAAASLARATGHLKFRVVDESGSARHLTDRGVFRSLSEPAE